jgi:peptide/nickel transport system permease protein
MNNSPLAIGFMKLRKNKLAIFGLIMLTLLTLAAVFAPLLATHERDKTNLREMYAPPSKEHILGTDELGRDVYTRLIYGARVSLSVGLFSTAIATLIGVTLGSVAGYFGGIIDGIIMIVVDIFMCFPFFVIAIVVAAIMGPSVWNVIVITGILTWPTIARIVRAEVLSIREKEFVEAARALGLTPIQIIIRHIIPNTLGVTIVFATLGVAHGILSEAGLSFLGLGVKQPMSSWGNMLAAAQSVRSLTLHWWLWVPSGLLVVATILSINFLGDGLRDALDPKQLR